MVVLVVTVVLVPSANRRERKGMERRIEGEIKKGGRNGRNEILLKLEKQYRKKERNESVKYEGV